MDRRIDKTEKALEDGLSQLLSTGHDTEITIKELCECANINRSTFYAHYKDMNSFLDAMEDKLTDQCIEALELYKYDMDSAPVINQLFTIMHSNPLYFALTFRESSSGSASDRVFGAIKGKTIPTWLEESDITKEQAEMLFQYITKGVFAVIKYWYQTGCTTPEDEVKDICENMTKYGLYNYVYTK